MKEDAGLVFSRLIAALKEIPSEIRAVPKRWSTLWFSQAQAAKPPMQFVGRGGALQTLLRTCA
ncbi:hypothetical protein QTI51_36990 [Variovorax sp. J22G73]|uniref:hypothetical protein n=1 Tax=unclassified Variovorax TaxID=663243 RepID=UPI00257834DC|nr:MULTISPECIES: hypothetical protein [unclassified Variovorax]MDM0010493.1 hypothetical protein [Variovorax sp. J22R203]MDM0102924.1 hypothetical protein [Variovorax sp. J22G73]